MTRSQSYQLAPQTVTLSDGRRLRVSVALHMEATGTDAEHEAALAGDGFPAEPAPVAPDDLGTSVTAATLDSGLPETETGPPAPNVPRARLRHLVLRARRLLGPGVPPPPLPGVPTRRCCWRKRRSPSRPLCLNRRLLWLQPPRALVGRAAARQDRPARQPSRRPKKKKNKKREEGAVQGKERQEV